MSGGSLDGNFNMYFSIESMRIAYIQTFYFRSAVCTYPGPTRNIRKNVIYTTL